MADTAQKRFALAKRIESALDKMQDADIAGDDRAMLRHARTLADAAQALVESAEDDGVSCRNWMLAGEGADHG